jgi:PAS domain S-box-containing protein
MFTSSMVEYKRLNMNLWPPPKGPLMTLGIALLSEIISRTLLDIPSVAPLFLAIVYTVFREGFTAGLISAAITIMYALYTFSTPGQILHYDQSGLTRAAVIVFTAPLLATLVGILKRKAEHEHTQASRAHMYQSLLLQHISDAIIITDANFSIELWNPASETIYGWSAAEVKGKTIRDVIPIIRYVNGATREETLAILQDTAHWEGRVIQKHRAGHELLIDGSVHSILDADGTTVGYVAVNRDMTQQAHAEAERKQLLEQLEMERGRLEAILQQMPAGVAIADASSGQVILGNEQLASILRYPSYTPNGTVRYDRYQGFHPDGRPYTPEEWPLARSMSTGKVIRDEEIDILRADGTLGSICVSSAPIYDRQGTIIAGVITFYDITEHKRTEHMQRFLAQASSMLVNSLDYESTIDAIVRLAIPYLADWCCVHLIDERGSLRRPAVAHVDPALEETIRDLQRRYPLDLTSDSPIIQVLHTGQAQWTAEVDDAIIEHVSSDQYHRQMLRVLGFKAYMILPLSARGRTLGAVTFVSAKRRYDPCDLEQAQELTRRCALAVDNARLYSEAQQAIRTRNELILMVSHDLKNPLSAIKGYANLLQRRIQRINPSGAEWLEESLVSIDATAKKMTVLLNELLDFARLQAGQTLELDRRMTDLVTLARQTVAAYQQATERHHIAVVADLPTIVGLYDTARLERVLANLLSNALKYSPDGGEITVEIRREETPTEQWALLSVRDQGLGIPAHDLPHVFEAFHRAGNVIGRVRGTGIGLTSAKQIVEQHGGTLTVSSIEGRGTTFTIRLPLTTDISEQEQIL